MVPRSGAADPGRRQLAGVPRDDRHGGREGRRARARQQVLGVIGAGQGGLAVAANLPLMGLDTLVLEKSERVGDGWRKRYHSLVLHDPVWADSLPYMPYPESWPVYCPKDKIADWFESYARLSAH